MGQGLHIFVDMDGVLSDFDKRYEQKFGHKPKDVPKKLYSQQWDKFIEDHEFSKLDPFPGSFELIRELEKYEAKGAVVSILSSAGGFRAYNEVANQKRIWLALRQIQWPIIIVPGRRYKKGFAAINKPSILIDDHVENCRDWESQGQISILHTDAELTIADLDYTMAVNDWGLMYEKSREI